MRVICTFLLLGAAIQCGCQKPEQTAMNDIDRVQGEWVLVSGERHGKVLAETVVRNVRLTFDGNVLATTKPDGVTEMTFTLHPEMDPKGIDVDMDGSLGLGIYKIEGEMLTIVHGEVEAPRPENFEAIKNGTLNQLVLRKASD